MKWLKIERWPKNDQDESDKRSNLNRIKKFIDRVINKFKLLLAVKITTK